MPSTTRLTLPKRADPTWRLAVAAALALALLWHGPIPQWDTHHAFADTGGWRFFPNAANVLSNLPIAWACAALLCAFLAERRCGLGAARDTRRGACHSECNSGALVADRTGRPGRSARLRVRAVLADADHSAALLARNGGVKSPAVPAHAWWATLALYAIAKASELADQPILPALGFVSGLTLKHLLAAAASLCLVMALRALRQAVAVQLR